MSLDVWESLQISENVWESIANLDGCLGVPKEVRKFLQLVHGCVCGCQFRVVARYIPVIILKSIGTAVLYKALWKAMSDSSWGLNSEIVCTYM